VLAGTPKQVAWAVSIRAAFLVDLPGQLAGLGKAVSAQRGAALTRPEEALGVLRTIACRETSAPWWIRNRDRLADSLRQRHHVTLKMGDAGETARRVLMWAAGQGNHAGVRRPGRPARTGEGVTR
jgi:hypothetical protein